MEMKMTTTTANNPLVELVDQLCAQSDAVHIVLSKQIEAMSPSDPDDREEFDVLRKMFTEYQKEIHSLLESQAIAMESLVELGEVASQAV
jgi:hypothetical protein